MTTEQMQAAISQVNQAMTGSGSPVFTRPLITSSGCSCCNGGECRKGGAK